MASDGVVTVDMVQGVVGAHAIRGPDWRGDSVSAMEEQVSQRTREEDEDCESRKEEEDGEPGKEASGSDKVAKGAHADTITPEEESVLVSVITILLIFLVLILVLPFQLQKSTQAPTPRPREQQTLSPSWSPKGVPFVELGPELRGENENACLGAAVVVVEGRWFAYGSPGRNPSGVVRVVDMYNGTQIGQDIVGSTEPFGEVGWVLASAPGGWLAVAGRHTVRLLRYNHNTALWEQCGRIWLGPISTLRNIMSHLSSQSLSTH